MVRDTPCKRFRSQRYGFAPFSWLASRFPSFPGFRGYCSFRYFAVLHPDATSGGIRRIESAASRVNRAIEYGHAPRIEFPGLDIISSCQRYAYLLLCTGEGRRGMFFVYTIENHNEGGYLHIATHLRFRSKCAANLCSSWNATHIRCNGDIFHPSRV